MPYRPGISVISRSAPTPRGIPTDTGTWFVVGAGQKGSTTVPKLIRSMGDYQKYFGGRSVGSTVFTMYDALETFFREGGSQAYVVRVEGAAATAATKTLLDGAAGNSLKINAKNVGTWGNALTVQVVAGVTAGTFILVIFNSGVEVDRSPEFADTTAALAWDSDWVSVTFPSSPTSVDPAVAAAAALTGGTDNNAGIDDTLRQAALAYFTADLGPGQISIPGTLTTGNRGALITHARNFNRQALLDSTDTGTKATLVSEGNTLQADGNEFGALVGPWVYIPGLDPATKRTVPPVGLAAGLIARNDAINGTSSPAAGANGTARYVLGPTQASFTDADRQDLNEAGLDLVRVNNGQIQLYGYRTLGLKTGPWNVLSVQRTRMALVAEFSSVADRYVFALLDGKRHTISQFGGELTAVCERFRNLGALYGDTAEEAYFVDVSEAVNTPTTIAANELHAVVSVRISGMAEFVSIEIVKVANSQNLT
jgi:phage tail sheath protein FI